MIATKNYSPSKQKQSLNSSEENKMFFLTKNLKIQKKEVGGVKGPEPTRYGDWEKNGRCSDF
tara:strand:- start:817 stop:1002 length:186 start_codon:yes stop_codon:yes gene_type:complete